MRKNGYIRRPPETRYKDTFKPNSNPKTLWGPLNAPLLKIKELYSENMLLNLFRVSKRVYDLAMLSPNDMLELYKGSNNLAANFIASLDLEDPETKPALESLLVSAQDFSREDYDRFLRLIDKKQQQDQERALKIRSSRTEVLCENHYPSFFDTNEQPEGNLHQNTNPASASILSK